MADYDPARTVIEISRAELIEIFRWIRGRGEDPQNPTTVLVGGWAVYSYNPWYGSFDIDLVTNHRTKQHLITYLLRDRGYVRKRHPMIPNTVARCIPEGEILIDFASREDRCFFEGRSEECSFSILTGQTEIHDLGAGIPVAVPARTPLLIFKLKAAWDRSFRITHHTSVNEEWEKSKLRKDHADVIALLDPNRGGTETDIVYLSRKIEEYPFLKDILREIPRDSDAIGFYRNLAQREVQEIIDRVLLLAS